jgi:hypothetical protein
MLVVSLTQVKVALSLPFGLSVLDYQRRRAKNLKKRGWTGVDYPEFSVPPRRQR